MDLDNAIRLEVGWGMRFRQAIRSGEQFYVEIIGHDDCCDFGRWLYRDAVGAYGHLPQFLPCIEAHAAFHGQAALVAQAINDRRYRDAERLLAVGGPYALAADRVAEAIGRLRWSVRDLDARLLSASTPPVSTGVAVYRGH